VPETITIDGSAAHEAAIKRDNAADGTTIDIRQITSLNNIVEQDHRGVKRVTRPRLGFTSFEAAQATLVGIEPLRRLKKDQLEEEARTQGVTRAEQCSSLAAEV
jgi:putative transposase